MSHFSLRTLYRVAEMIAPVLRNTPNQVSRQMRSNISLCCADLEPREQRQLYRDAMRHTCYAMTELAAVWCWPVDRVLERITSIDICPEFETSGRARIVIAPHLGSWETLAVWLGKHYQPIMMYKRRKNKALDQYIKQARARSGGTLVPTKKHGLRQLLLGMKQGGSLMILPDQKPGGNKARIDSSFFGVSAPTTTLVQNLCTKVDCDVFIAAVCRSTPAGEFNLLIRPLDAALLAGDEAGSAQYMNDQIEALVRENLAQYQWGYRRFSNRSYASLDKEKQ